MATVDAAKADEFRARRTRIGMSVSALAKRAKVDRGRLSALEAGEGVSDRTIGKVEQALTEIEHELGMGDTRQIGDPTDDMVEFSFTVDGSPVRAVVKGPIRNLAELQKAAADLARDLTSDVPDTPRAETV